MSCRRGVPKNDCSCCKSLAEKVRELWERAANAIKTINGVQADGANNFDILPGAGIQVNPRANGIEIVNTGAIPPEDDSIKTINYVQPDEDGDFILRGGTGVDIEEIEDEEGINGLEISCTVEAPTYTGVSPIEISADNEISIKDWVIHSTDYRDLITSGYTNTEILVVIKDTAGATVTLYIPKNTDIQSGELELSYCNYYIASLPSFVTRLKIFKNLTASTIQPNRTTIRLQDQTGYYTLTVPLEYTGNTLHKRATTNSQTDSIYLYTRD